MDKRANPTGKLYISKKLFKEIAELEYEDDPLSNHKNKGRIKVDYLTADFQNNFNPGVKFEFFDKDNISYFGIITGIQNVGGIYSHSFYLLFVLTKKQQHVRYKRILSKKLLVTYSIPFCQLLSRGFKLSYGYDDSYLMKFNGKPLILKLQNIEILFEERVNFAALIKSNSTISRSIVPTIYCDFRNRRKYIAKLNEYEGMMNDVMLVISFFSIIKWIGTLTILK